MRTQNSTQCGARLRGTERGDSLQRGVGQVSLMKCGAQEMQASAPIHLAETGQLTGPFGGGQSCMSDTAGSKGAGEQALVTAALRSQACEAPQQVHFCLPTGPAPSTMSRIPHPEGFLVLLFGYRPQIALPILRRAG